MSINLHDVLKMAAFECVVLRDAKHATKLVDLMRLRCPKLSEPEIVVYLENLAPGFESLYWSAPGPSD